MKKLKQLKALLQSEKEKKSNLVGNIQDIDKQLNEKTKQLAEDQNNNIDVDDLVKDIKDLRNQKETEKIKLEAFESREAEIEVLANEVKSEFLQAKKEYQEKIRESTVKVKQLKKQFNDDIAREKEFRTSLTNELNQSRFEVESTIRGIIPTKGVSYSTVPHLSDISTSSFKHSEIN